MWIERELSEWVGERFRGQWHLRSGKMEPESDNVKLRRVRVFLDEATAPCADIKKSNECEVDRFRQGCPSVLPGILNL